MKRLNLIILLPIYIQLIHRTLFLKQFDQPENDPLNFYEDAALNVVAAL